MKRCKDCKWFHPIPEKEAGWKFKKYGGCFHLTLLDDIVFLQAGKEIAGGYIVHENFGCVEFENK